jgi:hypothetical protein
MISMDGAGAGVRPAELRICEGYLAPAMISRQEAHSDQGTLFVHIYLLGAEGPPGGAPE